MKNQLPAAIRLPDDVFPHVRADYDQHDKTCISLRYLWIARTGGVSAFSDLERCTDCDVTFYGEGVCWVNHTDPDGDEVRVCGCCALRRGYVLIDTEHGVTLNPTHRPRRRPLHRLLNLRLRHHTDRALKENHDD